MPRDERWIGKISSLRKRRLIRFEFVFLSKQLYSLTQSVISIKFRPLYYYYYTTALNPATGKRYRRGPAPV